jgi:pimeloyl-ACP methyl ester carboxylesterase
VQNTFANRNTIEGPRVQCKLFIGFEARVVDVIDTVIFLRQSGSGPPVLLLHGFPETHVMWHRVAPALAEDFSVVCADLRGYGSSGTPPERPQQNVARFDSKGITNVR